MNPPDPRQNLMSLLAKRKPKMFPDDHTKAAEFWMAHQEPPNEESEHITPKKSPYDGEIMGWNTPYHDRLIRNLRKFLTMGEVNQVYIIQKIENGIPWRGDDMWNFKQIVVEAEKMAKDKKPYIKKAEKVSDQVRGAA